MYKYIITNNNDTIQNNIMSISETILKKDIHVYYYTLCLARITVHLMTKTKLQKAIYKNDSVKYTIK